MLSMNEIILDGSGFLLNDFNFFQFEKGIY